MVYINPTISMTTLNVKWPKYANFKDRDCQNGGGKRNKTQLPVIHKNLLYYKITDRLKVKEWRKIKILPANTNEKKVGVAILISPKANFRTRKIIRDNERH